MSGCGQGGGYDGILSMGFLLSFPPPKKSAGNTEILAFLGKLDEELQRGEGGLPGGTGIRIAPPN